MQHHWYTSIRRHQSFAANFRIDEDVRQCLLYDSAEKNARLLGVEYMISPRLYDGLPADEQRLWHSHVYEVKSGMLVMPNRLTPDSAWEVAERKEMEHVIKLYGKAYHMWQVDKGHNVPLGEPQLMTSFTTDGQLDFSKVKDRDSRLGTSFQNRKEARANIPEPSVHPSSYIAMYSCAGRLDTSRFTDQGIDADSAWQKKKFGV